MPFVDNADFWEWLALNAGLVGLAAVPARRSLIGLTIEHARRGIRAGGAWSRPAQAPGRRALPPRMRPRDRRPASGGVDYGLERMQGLRPRCRAPVGCNRRGAASCLHPVPRRPLDSPRSLQRVNSDRTQSRRRWPQLGTFAHYTGKRWPLDGPLRRSRSAKRNSWLTDKLSRLQVSPGDGRSRIRTWDLFLIREAL
jgi:hypothetical protein